jgi:hypothetical protein
LTGGICGGIFSGELGRDYWMKTKVTFFLPLQDNDGRDLTEEIQAVEEECFVAIGGWTLAGYFKGIWRMEDGMAKTDISAVYMVVIDDEDLQMLEAIIQRFKKQTTQEAIFMEVIRDVDIRFI